jgi:hypothetical protein
MGIPSRLPAGFSTSAHLLDATIAAADVADSAGLQGLYVQKYALGVYDFAVDGGASGAIVLTNAATLPDNAVVTAITYDVLTTCTSAADSGTIAISVPTDGALTTAIAISDGTNPWDAGAHLANVGLPKKLTAARKLGITVATQDLTAGKFVFAVQYYIGQ